MLAYEFFQGTPFTIQPVNTPRFHIQALVLLKIAYFQEKVTTTFVPIQPQIFTETTQVILRKYLPSCIRWKWILELIIIHSSFLLTAINHKSCTLSHNFSQNRKICLLRKLFTETTQVILIKYLPSYVRWKWILELIIIHFSASYVF